ncbi:DJ-1/PfpI family protein [Nocardioides nematodiphilus]|uniref:DJ-1/PfpI family protein n=1 Tax=Nocardioides nematodiphilus TaxID=2849669 RepID=UPI001CD9EC29|nr:DJ-1/PfpI family protein [Nocardioides nematodiphilus]MCA1984634.1 DJ-1/PfpI family protein [Nocardioides nematodiphilus]
MSIVERTVGILAFDDMEVLDYAGPYEVFNVAGEVSGGAFRTYAIGVDAGSQVGRGGFTVVPPASIADTELPTILVVPGGAGTRPLLRRPEVLAWVTRAAEHAELVLSVCTGALVLAGAGVLAATRATTHHGAFDELGALMPEVEVVSGERFVQNSQRVWTSGGISAGIDLSLHIVGLLAGEDTRAAVVEEMEWLW